MKYRVEATYDPKLGLIFVVIDAGWQIDEAFYDRSIAEAWCALQNRRARA